MVNIKNILKKDNLIGAAGLGAGSLGAEVVLSKVAPMLPDAAAKFAPALPILAGGDVMMGNVMMGESLSPVAGFSSDSYDYTSGDAGEMNY